MLIYIALLLTVLVLALVPRVGSFLSGLALIAFALYGLIILPGWTWVLVGLTACILAVWIYRRERRVLKPFVELPRTTEINEQAQKRARQMVSDRSYSFQRFCNAFAPGEPPVPPEGIEVYDASLFDVETKKQDVIFYYLKNTKAVFVFVWSDMKIETTSRQLKNSELSE